MKVAGILQSSIVDGEGIRDVLFLQGCKHQCKGCHNWRTWDIEGGMEYSVDELEDNFKLGEHDITISGGEPLLQFQDGLYHFMKRMHREYGKRFWLYTGYRYEEIPNFVLIMLSEFTDVLVDGRFELDKKDPNLQFRGSSNQRLIDLPKSVKEEKVVLWEVCE